MNDLYLFLWQEQTKKNSDEFQWLKQVNAPRIIVNIEYAYHRKRERKK